MNECYKLVKNGFDWDYSDMLADVQWWREKVLREEPDAVVEIVTVSREAMDLWKEYGIS